MQEVHIGNTGRMFAIQSPNGVEKYYFKPAETKDREVKLYRAYIQESAYNIQQIINPTRAVKCNVCNINGTVGTIQEKIEIDEEATKQFYRYFENNVGKLSPKIISQILDEYLVDYSLCNYDAHARNFIIDKNGNLRGIDKEQSFRYIDKDVTGDMLFSQNYNEVLGENETIYATIFKKIASGEISHKMLEGLNYRVSRLAQIPNDQYRDIFKSYANSKAKTPEEAKILLDKIVNRKQSITKKIDMLKQNMYSQSYGKAKGNGGIEEYMFTDNIRPTPTVVPNQNIRPTQNMPPKKTPTPLKRPYIKQEVIKTVIERGTKRQEQIPWATSKKEELLKQKRELGRLQFQKRTTEIGLGEKKPNNLHELYQEQKMLEQKRQQQIRRQQEMEEMLEEDHGMSM